MYRCCFVKFETLSNSLFVPRDFRWFLFSDRFSRICSMFSSIIYCRGGRGRVGGARAVLRSESKVTSLGCIENGSVGARASERGEGKWERRSFRADFRDLSLGFCRRYEGTGGQGRGEGAGARFADVCDWGGVV